MYDTYNNELISKLKQLNLYGKSVKEILIIAVKDCEEIKKELTKDGSSCNQELKDSLSKIQAFLYEEALK